MSTTLTPPPESPATELPATTSTAAASQDGPPAPTSAAATWAIAATGGLSAGAVGWTVGGIFAGSGARFVGLIAAAIGAAVAGSSLRLPRPGFVQSLAAPAGLLFGVLLAAPDASGSANILALIRDAVLGGGLGQPPVPFDPGWRVILSGLIAALAAGAVSLGASANRPVRAAAIPLPLLVLAALGQPEGAETTSIAVGMVLTLAAFVVATASEQAADGVTSGGFRVRRLTSSLVSLATMAAGVLVLAQVASAILPEPSQDQVIPPQRPPAAPPQPDRELFTTNTTEVIPWRLGVLDVFQDNAWMLPPFDPARRQPVDGPVNEDGTSTGAAAGTVTFTISELGGRSIPMPAGAVAVNSDAALEFDPRTGALRSVDLAGNGLTYTVEVRTAPDVAALREAASADLAAFLATPDPSPAVRDLLDGVPVAPWFDRLQAVRQRYFDIVVAAGAGNPVDVPMERVDEILAGRDASPYEITAVEALLARWAGVPSRIGFGYLGGEVVDNGRSLRPVHGRVWLEVFVDDYGWMPIVGKPPRATSSFSEAQKNPDSTVLPTDRLALITYVPVRRETLQLQFEIVRWWAVRLVPAAAGLALAFALLPVPLRAVRSRRRRRWARERGPAAQIATIYAGFREALWDMNLARLGLTPLELTRHVEDDAEHRDLAFLVTRALWGDLRRDLHRTDVEAADELSRSVLRRVRASQPASVRWSGMISRASLRSPWSDDLPSLRRGQATDRRPRRLTTASVAGGLLAVLLLTSCGQSLELGDPGDAAVLPDRLVPDRIAHLEVQREAAAEAAYSEGGDLSLIADGHVYTLREGEDVLASLQIATLRPGAVERPDEVQRGLLEALGGGSFTSVRVGFDRFAQLDAVEQRLLLWFSPDGTRYHLLVAPRGFDHAEAIMAAVLQYQRGEPIGEITDLDALTVITGRDVREGIPS